MRKRKHHKGILESAHIKLNKEDWEKFNESIKNAKNVIDSLGSKLDLTVLDK